ncbi:MAG: hypothetical protein HC927_04870 [Deltaproteobacteria bacterium]|nr:hypothetical protein [Deltaproteobacteria bacterium]
MDAKSLELVVDIDDSLAPVYGDPVRLQQVASNLLTNAVKFTPPQGRITVTLVKREDKVELCVSDTGIGIRPSFLPHLFDRFAQADSSMTRAHGGLGLGLAIVRHLVEVHGGEIGAESPGEGQGATFRVLLPLMAPDSSRVEHQRRTTTANISGIRVLLIDDDDDTRRLTEALLSEMGAEVRSAASSREGLA